MSQSAGGTQERAGIYGQVVSGSPKVLPATGLQSIFTISGGPVLITSLIGVVTTVCTATVTTITVGATPAGGASAPAVLATAGTVTSLPVGAYVSVIPFTASTTDVALAVSPAGGVLGAGIAAWTVAGVPLAYGGLAVVSAGAITITTSATNTGAFAWAASYVPLVAGASVVAV